MEVKITVVNNQQRERAEYARDHIEQFLYAFNGAFITIFEGDAESFDVPVRYEHEPDMIILYNYVFNPDELEANGGGIYRNILHHFDCKIESKEVK